MELQYYGANCLVINTKKARIVIDDNRADVGLKPITKDDDIVLVTNERIIKTSSSGRMAITYPGEYEVSNIAIYGIAARAHMDEDGKNAVMYRIVVDDVRVAVLGHIAEDLNEEQLEQIGTVDVLVVPVGGNGYTLDAIEVAKLVKKIEPHIVVPTHYEQKAVQYEVPQQPLDEVLKSLNAEKTEPVPKLKIKDGDIPELLEVVELEVTI